MTTEEPHVTPLGSVFDPNEIAGVHITINGEELTWKRAAKQLRILADLLEAHTLDSKGFNWQYGGDYEMQVMMTDMWPHGDYQDAEGNLLHIHDDVVVSVIWANKGAEKEEVEIPAHTWAQEHGPITPAGQGEAPEHEH